MNMTPGEWELDADGWCYEADRNENQKFIVLAKKAFDVMQKRGWGVLKMNDGTWGLSGIAVGGLSWPDPFTAIVEADKWYKANIESKAS